MVVFYVLMLCFIHFASIVLYTYLLLIGSSAELRLCLADTLTARMYAMQLEHCFGEKCTLKHVEVSVQVSNVFSSFGCFVCFCQR